MGGVEATAILRGNNVVDIVVLTANALTEHKGEALKAGATDAMPSRSLYQKGTL
jgi:CheY-like chemotaxis protein